MGQCSGVAYSAKLPHLILKRGSSTVGGLGVSGGGARAVEFGFVDMFAARQYLTVCS